MSPTATMYHACHCGSQFEHAALPLKTLDTIGNCQRPVFSLSVSQHAWNKKPVEIWTQLDVEVARG